MNIAPYIFLLLIRRLALWAVAVFISIQGVKAVEIVTYGDTNTPMAETLAFSHNSFGLDLNDLGFYKLSLALTGFTSSQTNPQVGNTVATTDFTNTQVIVEKLDGPVQLFAMVGGYSIPQLGTPFVRSSQLPGDSWGYLPAGWIKLPASDGLSMSVGKLFAIGGAEGTFTYENTNIQRGLIWAQTSSVTRGVQIDYQKDDLFASIALTDGSYSGTYNWLGAQVNYQLDKKNAITVSWNGSLSPNATQTFGTPLLQNNSQISTLIYSYKTPYFTLTPYLQYTYVPERPSVGILGSSSTQGAALLATYRIFPLDESGAPGYRNISFPLRLEYLSSSGNSKFSSNNLLYGPNSAAWSATVTPTFQEGMYFARVEASYVQAINSTPGTTFGFNGNANTQRRVMLEGGILF